MNTIMLTLLMLNYLANLLYPLVHYPHTYIALYHSHAKVTCNTHTHTQKQEIVNYPSLGSSLVS